MDHILSDLSTMTCPSWGGGSREEIPASKVMGGDHEEIPLSPRPGAAGGRSYPTPPCSRPGVAAGRSNPTPEARGSGREDQPHALAAPAQEGLKELSHIEGQEGRW